MREVPADEWDALLTGLALSDAYLLRAYVESACVLDPGEPVLLHTAGGDGDVVLACIVREIPGAAARDVTTPYGYGGPVGVGGEPPVATFYEQYEEWCAGRGVVSTFVRFHPLFANHRQAAASVQLERSGATAAWRLGDGRDLFAGMHRSHRNKCRKAERAGVQVRVTCHPEDLNEFAALYDTTMNRQRATDFYFFPPAYWERLTALGDRLIRFDATVDAHVVASAICLRGRPLAPLPPECDRRLGARPRRKQSPPVRGRRLGARAGPRRVPPRRRGGKRSGRPARVQAALQRGRRARVLGGEARAR